MELGCRHEGLCRIVGSGTSSGFRFPTPTDPSSSGPALVVAIPDDSGTPGLLWVLMITSAENRGWPGDVEVSDLKPAGLPAPSVVRAARIATIDRADADPIGSLAPPDRAGVAHALTRMLLTATAPP